MKSLRAVIVLSLLPFLGVSANAQEEGDAVEIKEKDRSFRVAFASLPRGLGKELFYGTEEGFASVPVNLYKISAPQPLAKEATVLGFFKEMPKVEADQPASVADHQIALPEALKILIVVFPKMVDGKAGIDAHPIDESTFPAGSIYFFNPTELHLGAALGEDKVTIRAGKEFLFRPPPIGDGKTVAVQIALHEEEGWKLFSSTRWHLSPKERHLLFFKINPRTRRADYDSLTDYFARE